MSMFIIINKIINKLKKSNYWGKITVNVKDSNRGRKMPFF